MNGRMLPCLLLLLLAACQKSSNGFVVVYTSQDQVYAEPILQKFTAETGIAVRPVFDGESVKTIGLANRIQAESSHPQCDLFWNNEAMLTSALATAGVLDPAQGWKEFGSRTRRLVYNTGLVRPGTLPGSLLELTNATWNKRVAIAYPLFGTTAAHFIALREKWGHQVWSEWCQGLVRNGALVVDGNSVVVSLVARGEAWIGLTDSDDIAAGQREGWPVAAAPLGPESLAIPNTIALIKGAPHAALARRLVDYLLRETTVRELLAAKALESEQPPLELPRTDWPKLAARLEPVRADLKQIFLRQSSR